MNHPTIEEFERAAPAMAPWLRTFTRRPRKALAAAQPVADGPASENVMSKPKHTPGPWSVYDGLGQTLAVCIGDEANGKRPCIVDWPGFDSCDLPFAQKRANAHLIAAAPDMLAELHRLHAKHGEQATADIIAKAEDRS